MLHACCGGCNTHESACRARDEERGAAAVPGWSVAGTGDCLSCTGMYSSRGTGGCIGCTRPLAIAVELAMDYDRRGCGGSAGQYCCGSGCGHGVRAMAMAAASGIPLYDPFANGAHCGDCAVDHSLD